MMGYPTCMPSLAWNFGGNASSHPSRNTKETQTHTQRSHTRSGRLRSPPLDRSFTNDRQRSSPKIRTMECGGRRCTDPWFTKQVPVELLVLVSVSFGPYAWSCTFWGGSFESLSLALKKQQTNDSFEKVLRETNFVPCFATLYSRSKKKGKTTCHAVILSR